MKKMQSRYPKVTQFMNWDTDKNIKVGYPNKNNLRQFKNIATALQKTEIDFIDTFHTREKKRLIKFQSNNKCRKYVQRLVIELITIA